MKLRELMTRDVVTISSNQSIITAAARMREFNVGSLVVMRGSDVEGIITTWDMTVGCLGAGHNPHDCVVFQHMSAPVHTGHPDIDSMEAAHVMAERRIKHLPIVESGALIGIVTFTNISRALDRLIRDMLLSWENPAV